MPIALTIAGSDPSGGAGLQADLKTFEQFRVFGTSVVTLITAQNTVGVQRVQVLAPELVGEQLASVLADVPPAAVKIGALGSAAMIRHVAGLVREHALRPLVIDPVMRSKHGHPLLPDDAVTALRDDLLPLATCITPNSYEAEALLGESLRFPQDLGRAAERLLELGCEAVLVKGGQRGEGDQAIDVLATADGATSFVSPRLNTHALHGTGCTLSAGITADLAHGKPLVDAVRSAKDYLYEAMRHAPGLGQGNGPVQHRL